VTAAAGVRALNLSYRHNAGQSTTALWLRALRWHQWLKNLLVLLPAAAAHRLTEPFVLTRALGAFAAFCLCASSVYLVNDVLDVRFDRQHPRKRERPFASGALRTRDGLLVAGLLLIPAVGLALTASVYCAAWLSLYYLLTLGYSARLKREAVLDVVVLAGLYTLRILAGGAAVGIEPSFWLLSFSMFMFLNLAIVKRFAELGVSEEQGESAAYGRGYLQSDSAVLLGLGPAAGFVAVLVLALYINSPEAVVLYRHPRLLWLLCPLILYWVMRVWFITTRGAMRDDPVVFAATDGVSLVVGASAIVVVLLAR
jgi:4-hydroxybenzoate polyprenyltransferase